MLYIYFWNNTKFNNIRVLDGFIHIFTRHLLFLDVVYIVRRNTWFHHGGLENIRWCIIILTTMDNSTYFFTEIFPALSNCMQSLVWAFCKKFVAEPFSWKRLYANFISSSVQCCNETKIKRKEYYISFLYFLCCFYDSKVSSV